MSALSQIPNLSDVLGVPVEADIQAVSDRAYGIKHVKMPFLEFADGKAVQGAWMSDSFLLLHESVVECDPGFDSDAFTAAAEVVELAPVPTNVAPGPQDAGAKVRSRSEHEVPLLCSQPLCSLINAC